jgi:hypothetical protein
MLQSPHEDQWERNYRHARTILRSNPEKVASLDKIYGNPSYYAGYYIASIPRNFGVLSSCQAHLQNKIILLFGHPFMARGTTSMEMEQQVTIHFECQARIIRERQSLSNLWTVRQAHTSKNVNPPFNQIELAGRKVLDRLLFNEYLERVLD